MPYIKLNRERSVVNRMDDIEILEQVRSSFAKIDKKMTNHQGLFFVTLIDYAISHGSLSKNGDYYVLFMSEDDMAHAFGFGKSFINNALSLYNQAGLIERKTLTTKQKKEMFKDGRFNIKSTKIYCKYFIEQGDVKVCQ